MKNFLTLFVVTSVMSATAFAQQASAPPTPSYAQPRATPQTFEFRDGYAEGSKDGYRDGYKQGFDEGFRKAQSELRREPPAVVIAPDVSSKNFPIAISIALYGSDTNNDKESCNAMRYVTQRANGRRNVSFEVSNEICGDPAPGKRKSLNVTYFCGGAAKMTSANEHRTIYLSCD